MSDYMDLVKKEATEFLRENHDEFVDDESDFGAKSETPNLLRWMDEKGSLAERIEEVAKNWGLKEFHWVQANTRSKAKQGGDPRSNAFGSFLQDVRFVIKKLAKK